MRLIYTNVPPLKLEEGQQSLPDYIAEKAQEADELIIAVGYASKKSLLEIERIVREYSISRIELVLGMYCIEGFPESIYNTAIRLHKHWERLGIGEVRAIRSLKYHGKVYAFYKDRDAIAAVIGSHNLGSISKDATNLRQYEISACTESSGECSEVDSHLRQILNPQISLPLPAIRDPLIIHEENRKLNGVEGVTKLSTEDVATNKLAQTDISFDIPLKVPGMPKTNRDYMKSNINKCYAKGRENKKTSVVTERGWWETEIIVSNTITRQENYPAKDTPFFVITDDGWQFKMHVSGDYKKNFESDGDLKILGYWLKGRLVAAGIVEPVDSPAEDLNRINPNEDDIYTDCRGVITYQKLVAYGKSTVTLTKTMNSILDETGVSRDVWMLSFLPESVQ